MKANIRECSIDGCHYTHSAKGFCNYHYRKMRGCKGIADKHHRWPERTQQWTQIHCLDCGTASHKPTHSEDTPWFTKPIPQSVRERIEKKIRPRELVDPELRDAINIVKGIVGG